MGIEPSEAAQLRGTAAPLSGRARAALQQHQRRVAVLQRELQSADRMLAGALSACDGLSQREMLGTYLETVQELRVSLQRLESFLMERLRLRDELADAALAPLPDGYTEIRE